MIAQSPMDNIKIIGPYTYSVRHCIGQGSYGKVFEGHETSSHSQVAIKQMDLRFFENDKYLKSQLQIEIEVLKRLKHLNIVRLIDVLQSYNSLYIITEFCKDGDLREKIIKKQFKESEAINILFQILEGFKQLVQNGIIHRDLKPANILIHNGVYKIADFGFARFVNNFNHSLLKSCVGSPLYMAPQLLMRKPYTTKCDIWSIGVILYEIIFNETPWKGKDEKDLLNNILKKPLNLPKNIKLSRFTEELLKKTLCVEEKDRISWEELFQMKEKKIKKDQEINERENKPPISQQVISEDKKPSDSMLAEYKRYTKLVSLIREDLCFKHYVVMRIFLTGESILKIIKNKNYIIEKFILLCSQAIRQASNAIVLDLNEKEHKRKDLWTVSSELSKLTSALKKESIYYMKFYEDLLDLYKKNNLYESLKEDKDLDGLLENEINERKRENLGIFIKKYSIEILKDLNDEWKGDDDRELIVSIDYLIDLIACLHRKKEKKAEIDYDQLHKEKSERIEFKNYWEHIISNRNVLLRKDL